MGPRTKLQCGNKTITYQYLIHVTMDTLKRTRRAIKRDIEYLQHYLQHIEEEGTLFKKKYKKWSPKSRPDYSGTIPIKLENGSVIVPVMPRSKCIRLLCDKDVECACSILGCRSIHASRMACSGDLSHISVCNAHRQVLTSKMRYITGRSSTSYKIREIGTGVESHALVLRHDKWCLVRPSPEDTARILSWGEVEFTDRQPVIEPKVQPNRKQPPPLEPYTSDSSE